MSVIAATADPFWLAFVISHPTQSHFIPAFAGMPTVGV